MELNLKNGIFRRNVHDLNNVIVNLKKTINKNIAEINVNLPKQNRILPIFILFKDNDFKETEEQKNIPNIVYFIFNLNKRTVRDTDKKSFHSNMKISKPYRYEENGTFFITPKANTLSLKIYCKNVMLLFKMFELVEDIFIIEPENVCDYSPNFSVEVKSINSNDEQFNAMEFLITFETQHVFKEFDREKWIATIVEDFTQNLIDKF